MTKLRSPLKTAVIKREHIRCGSNVFFAGDPATDGTEEIQSDSFTVRLKRNGAVVSEIEIRCQCGATLALNLVYTEDAS